MRSVEKRVARAALRSPEEGRNAETPTEIMINGEGSRMRVNRTLEVPHWRGRQVAVCSDALFFALNQC